MTCEEVRAKLSWYLDLELSYQESQAVREHLEHAFREDEPALLGLRLEDLEDDLLLLHGDQGLVAHAHLRGQAAEVGHAHQREVVDVQLVVVRGRDLRPRSPAGR